MSKMGQKLVEILENNVEVASTELRSEYDKEFNRAMISYVRFDSRQQLLLSHLPTR